MSATAKNVLIYYFSGTGNTELAAEMVCSAFFARGAACVLHDTALTNKAPLPDPNAYDVVGFAYPIHAFNAPRFFLSFVKRLPEVAAKPAFIFKTSGEPFALNSASSFTLTNILRAKGFLPAADTHMLMPYNIICKYPPALAKQMYLHTRSMAELVVCRALGSVPQEPSFSLIYVLGMYAFRIQWLGAHINGPLIHTSKECIGCSLCSHSCPAHNIVMKNNRPVFGSHCTMCMRCVFRCPKDAVRPGILDPWRVNADYGFENLLRDPSVPQSYVNAATRGYFRSFLPYYRRTELLLGGMDAKLGEASSTPASCPPRIS